MPLNVMDPHFKSFEREVLPVLMRDGIGVLGMKPLGSGDILRSGSVNAIECLHYAMNLPCSVVITGCESERDLEQAIAAARSFAPLSAEEVAQLLAKTQQPGRDGKYEAFKATRRFDGTAQTEKWLTTAEL